MFFQDTSTYTIDTTNVKIKMDIYTVDKLTSLYNVSISQLLALFSDIEYSNLQKICNNLLKIWGYDIEITDEAQVYELSNLIVQALMWSLPTANDIPNYKKPEIKDVKKKKKTKQTELKIERIIYIGVAVLNLSLSAVKRMTIRQIMILYGQHLLNEFGEEEVADINDMIPI